MSFLTFFKYVLVIYNFFVMLFGASILGLSIYFYIDTLNYIGINYVDPNNYINHVTWPLYSIVFIIVLGIGLLTFIVGFFGCCGACKESSCMICFYLTICLAICALGGALVYLSEKSNLSSTQIKEYMEQDIRTIMQTSYSKYNESSAANIFFDRIQDNLQCCGVSNYTDWSGAAINNASKIELSPSGNPNPSYVVKHQQPSLNRNIASHPVYDHLVWPVRHQQPPDAPTVNTEFKVPRSCCSKVNLENYKICTSDIARYDIGSHFINHVNSQGCVDKLYTYLFQDNRWPLNIIGGLAIGLQGLSIIFSCCLCCAINRAIDDEDDDEQK